MSPAESQNSSASKRIPCIMLTIYECCFYLFMYDRSMNYSLPLFSIKVLKQFFSRSYTVQYAIASCMLVLRFTCFIKKVIVTLYIIFYVCHVFQSLFFGLFPRTLSSFYQFSPQGAYILIFYSTDMPTLVPILEKSYFLATKSFSCEYILAKSIVTSS